MKRKIYLAVALSVVFLGSYLAWATVSSQTTKVSFTCNGSTTTFACTGGNKIPCFAATDIKVYIRTDSTGAESLLTLTSDYSVTAFNNDFTNGFTVTTIATYASGKTLVVKRAIALTQDVNLIRGRAIPAEPMERTLDRQILALQDKVEVLGRALRIPVTDSSYDMNLPSSVDRKGKYLGFSSATGDPIVTAGTADSVAHSPFMETVADDADAAAALTTLGLSTYVQTLIDAANSADFQTTLNITSYAQTILDDADSAEARTTLGVIPANNTYLVGVDAAGTGTVDLIKVDTNDIAVIPDNSQTATNAAPTSSTGIANKKYVEDQIAAFIASNVSLSARTNQDSENNAMLKTHAYLAQSDGEIGAYFQASGGAQQIYGYIGSTTDPVGAGDLVRINIADPSNLRASISFLVANGEYFEIRSDGGNAPIIYWRSFGTLSKPVDQD